MLDVSRASSEPCVSVARNSAHFSGVSAGSESETKICTMSPVDAVTGPPRQVSAARADRSIAEAPAWPSSDRANVEAAGTRALVAS